MHIREELQWNGKMQRNEWKGKEQGLNRKENGRGKESEAGSWQLARKKRQVEKGLSPCVC